MKRISIAIALTVALAVALSLALLGGGPRPRGRDVSRTAPAAAAASASRPTSRVRATARPSLIRNGWAEGSVHRYRLDARQTLSLGAQPAVQVRVEGLWETFVVAHGGGLTDIEARLVEPTVTLGDGGALPEDVLASLGASYGFSVDDEGAVVEVRFPTDLPAAARSLLRAPIALSQVRRGEGSAYSVEEDDSTGTCLVSYEVAGAHELAKRCTRYLQVATDAGMVASASIGTLRPSGSTQVRLGADGRVESVRAATAVAGQASALQFEARLDATLVLASSYVDSRREAVKGALVAAPMAAAESVAVQQEVRPVATVLDDLAGVTEAGERRAALQVELEKALRADDRAVAPALEAVRGGTHAQSGPILAALCAAGTPAAQSGLVSLAEDLGLDPETRSDSLSMMALVRQPTEASVGALRKLAEGSTELSGTAALALGAAAGRTEGEAADAALAELLARLEAAGSTGEAVLALAALGNTGDARIVPAVQAALTSPVPELRAAAVAALRLVPGTTVDALIRATLLADPSPDVRVSAVSAASRRPLPPFGVALHRALNADAEPMVRLAAVQLVGGRLDEIPALASALSWNAESDPDPQVRSVAAALLGYE